MNVFGANAQATYYFQADTGLLIRAVFTDNMTNLSNSNLYRTYYIEKNLVSIDNQFIDYQFVPPITTQPGSSPVPWIWIIIGTIAVAIGAGLIVYYWRKSAKTTLPVTEEPKAGVPPEDMRNTDEVDNNGLQDLK